MSNPERDGRVRQIRERNGSLTSEQVKRAALIAESRGIDEELAQELVYLRDRLTPLNETATKLHHWEPSSNGECVICGKLKLWQFHIDETISTTGASEVVEAFCDKWGWIPEPAMLLDLGQRFNNTATRMRDRCVAKVKSLADAYKRKSDDQFKQEHWTSHEHFLSEYNAACEIITALESLTLEGEQEKP